MEAAQNAGLATFGDGYSARAMGATPTYWFAMFAASALGTNLGDFFVDVLSLGGWTSFTCLAAVAGCAVLADRRVGSRSNAAYWIAIVALRAGATNVADLLTHDLKLGYLVPSLVLCAATLLAGQFSRFDKARNTSPLIDFRYWTAMFLAGIFGTTAGDMIAHSIGLYAAAALLCLTLIGLVGLRRVVNSAAMYWCVVLAERCAGTPVGDALASHRAVDLGLPLAAICTGTLLAAALLAHGFSGRTPRR